MESVELAIIAVEKQINGVEEKIAKLLLIAGEDGSGLTAFQKEMLEALRGDKAALRGKETVLRQEKLLLIQNTSSSMGKISIYRILL